MSDDAHATPFQTILAWSQRDSCPAWHADALRRLVADGKLSEADLDELVSLARRENGATDVQIAAHPLTATHLPASPKHDKSVALLGLRDPTGVNQLAAAQTLEFEPGGITIIYGDNGAGKSGYARILKRACRARSRGAILPNAFDDDAPSGPATAAFDYAQGGVKAAAPINWTDGPEPDTTLSAISVFDRQSGNVHLTGKNDVAFRPHGLDIPDALADAFGTIRNLLSADQEELHRHRHVSFNAPPWNADTAVGRILGDLKPNTDINALKALAVVSEDDKTRHAQLLKDLAHDPIEAASEKRVLVGNLRRLAATLQDLQKSAENGYLSGLPLKMRAPSAMRPISPRPMHSKTRRSRGWVARRGERCLNLRCNSLSIPPIPVTLILICSGIRVAFSVNRRFPLTRCNASFPSKATCRRMCRRRPSGPRTR